MDTISDYKGLFKSYSYESTIFDEVFDKEGKVKHGYEKLLKLFKGYSKSDFTILNNYAKKAFLNQGITFATYKNNNMGTERIFPFDLFPRIIRQKEWSILEKGLLQRNKALNLFIEDVYNDKKILKDKVVPKELVYSCSGYHKELQGIKAIKNIYNHICGSDLILHNDGNFYVLEDNVRCPSGVSYVLSNRETMKKVLSNVFSTFNVSTVNEYPDELLSTLKSVSPNNIDNPVCVVLTPGVFNSAYYEHSFLAQSMGLQLVEPNDLFVEKDFVYMHSIFGPQKVDVIYRRIDDDFLDPEVFRPDSLLGIKGVMRVYQKGNVALINAPGTGVADDKAVYQFVPKIIKYYLDEDPILSNVPTFLCEDEKERNYVLENIHKLVVKPVDQSGGYGVLIGDSATKKELEEQKAKIKENPRNYIAQPIMSLSVHSTYIDENARFEPRRVDLRTYTLLGKDKDFVLKGGLSRVALKEGCLIVNSSQGGGSKDTWIVEDEVQKESMSQSQSQSQSEQSSQSQSQSEQSSQSQSQSQTVLN